MFDKDRSWLDIKIFRLLKILDDTKKTSVFLFCVCIYFQTCMRYFQKCWLPPLSGYQHWMGCKMPLVYSSHDSCVLLKDSSQDSSHFLTASKKGFRMSHECLSTQSSRTAIADLSETVKSRILMSLTSRVSFRKSDCLFLLLGGSRRSRRLYMRNIKAAFRRHPCLHCVKYAHMMSPSLRCLLGTQTHRSVALISQMLSLLSLTHSLFLICF